MEWLKLFYGFVGAKYPVGSAIAVFIVTGTFFMALWIAIGFQYKKDHPIDHPVKPSPLANKVILKIVSPTVVDQTPIREAFRHFGVNWPPVEIRWPDSADELIDVLRRALELFDKGAASLVGADKFAKEAPGILGRIPEDRRRAEATIPAMVRRIRNLEQRYHVDAVTSFLLCANVKIHHEANYYASWQGLSELGLHTPVVWTTLREAANPLAVALGEPEEKLIGARLREVAGVPIFIESGSPGVRIEMPKRFATKLTARPYRLPRNELYWWGIPQLEYAADRVNELPDAYSEDWHFDKLDGE